MLPGAGVNRPTSRSGTRTVQALTLDERPAPLATSTWRKCPARRAAKRRSSAGQASNKATQSRRSARSA